MGFMVTTAVDIDHVSYGFSLAFHPFMFWVRRLRFHDGPLIKLYSNLIRIYPNILGFYFFETNLFPLM
jgi:hypothetical protein